MELHELIEGLGKLSEDYAVPAPPWMSEGEAPVKTAILQTVQIMAQQTWDSAKREVVAGPIATVALGLAYYDLPYLVTVGAHQSATSNPDEFTAVISLYAAINERGETTWDYRHRQDELPERMDEFRSKVWNIIEYHVSTVNLTWVSLVDLARKRLQDLFRLTKAQPEGTGCVTSEELIAPEDRPVKPEFDDAAEKSGGKAAPE